jgi:glycosyltransferase involved in cell wall biosynthesis
LPLASKNPARIWRNASRLADLIRAERVALVHARSRAPAWSAWAAVQRTGVRFVTTYHAPYGEEAPGKRAYNAVMARGERVIAISFYIGRLLIERHRVDPARIRVIPRGVDTAAFDPQAVQPDRLARLAASWRLPDGAPVIMLPGRLSRWKGQEVLIDALARMQDAVGVLVGPLDGRDRFLRELERGAARCGVLHRLRFAGQVDDMPAALMLADVVVSASTEPEGFGRAIVEAQAMGRMVIATDHGAAAETVEDGVTGWRIPPGDPAALAAALDRALSLDPAERGTLGARAREAVLARYTTAQMQAATIEVYRELLG